MSKSTKRRVANDPNRLTFDYVANRLSDGREAVVVSEETKITNKIGDQVINFTSRDVIELLVDNGDGTTTTLYTCRRGDYLNERPFPIISHITHHDRMYATGPRYTEDVIRTVLRTVKELRAAGVKNHNERAADRLNQLDVVSANGKRWTAGMIHHITQTYGKQFHVRIRRTPSDPAANATLTDVQSTEPPIGTERDEAILATIISSIDTLEGELKNLRTWVAAYAKVTESSVDISPAELDELRHKAQKWDQFRALASER